MSSKALEDLIYLFSKLPGLGSRSARRIILHLLQDKEIRLTSIIKSLENANANIKNCEICGNLDYDQICSICTHPSRNDQTIAIVDTVAELWALERSKIFSGRYHVLGSASSAINSSDLKLGKLYNRIETFIKQTNADNPAHMEVIIATNSTLDGQTRAYYITEYLKNLDVKVTRLASGVPIGGELDYLDEGTLAAAFERRTMFD